MLKLDVHARTVPLELLDLLDAQNVVNFVDLGSVKKTKLDTISRAGTPGYIAPELLAVSSRKYHKAQDVFSLGNVINEVFGFPANGHFQRFEQHNLVGNRRLKPSEYVKVASEYFRNKRPTYGHDIFDDIFDADDDDRAAVKQLTEAMTNTDMEKRGSIIHVG